MLPAWWEHEPYPANEHREVEFPCVCERGVSFFWGWGLDFGYFLVVGYNFFLLGLAQFKLTLKRCSRDRGTMTEWDMRHH